MDMTPQTIERLEQEKSLLAQQLREVQNQFEEKVAELSMIREIGMALLHVRSFERACEFISDVVINNTIAQNCSIMLLDRETKQLFLACATDSGKKHFILEAARVFSKEGLKYTFKPGEGAAGKAILEKGPVLIHDTRKSAHFDLKAKSQVKVRSLLCVPLMVENEPIGVLNLSHASPDIFEANDVNLFYIIANFVALAVHSTLSFEELTYSEAKYRALTENSNDGIAIIQDQTHMYVNPKYQELTGYGLEDLRRIPLADFFKNASAEKNPLETQSLLDFGSGNQLFEVQIQGRDGRRIDVEINQSSITYNGKPALIITVRDLTERKKLQKQLQQAQKMEAIGILAGGVAHDLNNVLSGLVGYPELALMGLPEESHLRRHLLAIQKSGEMAAAIVQDMLTLARRAVISRDIVNLNMVVTEYLASPEFKRLRDFHPGVTVQTDLERDLLNMAASPVHLFKTVMNLVSNAAEAMPNGGLITMTTENLHFDKPWRDRANLKEGDYVSLRISDNGVGISPEDMERVFEPFYTKKKMGRSGTGLGMTVVWGTVQDHEGAIDVQSTEGKGSTFILYFPASRKGYIRDEPLPLADEYSGHGKSILVVDDMQDQRDLASEMLGKLGYSVTCVSSGEKAVDYMKSHSADLVLLDMIMDPGIDGLETYKRILDLHPGQRAIIVSGFSKTDRVEEAQRLGAGGFLKKPYLLKNVGAAVRSELDR